MLMRHVHYKEMLAGYADPDACILTLILMLPNLNTGYADIQVIQDTDADLCIRIMSLCCIDCALSFVEF